MGIVARLLTPEAIAAGKTVKTTDDPLDYSIHDEYQNVKFLDPSKYPNWPTRITIPNYTFDFSEFSLYSINHNLGYNPIKKLYYQAINGRVYQLPSNSRDVTDNDLEQHKNTFGTFETERVYDPETDQWSFGTPDYTKQVNVIISNGLATSNNTPIEINVYNMIFVNESVKNDG